jgi:hypothetical protein
MRAEVENNLILGFCYRLRATSATAERPYLATVESANEILACALGMLPRKPIITRANARCLELLADDLLDKYGVLAGVLGPEPEVRQFAELWSSRSGRPSRVGRKQRLLEIRRVEPLQRRPCGRLRPAVQEDIRVLGPWTAAFSDEAQIPGISDPYRLARERIAEGNLFVWDDGGPVSMAAAAGQTRNGTRIGWVYTPLQHRHKGYASACVADFSELLLARGNSYCCLFTDLANPTSNKIYHRIGYRPVSDFGDYLL